MKKLKKSVDNSVSDIGKSLVTSEDAASMKNVTESPKTDDKPATLQETLTDSTGAANDEFAKQMLVLCIDAAGLPVTPTEFNAFGLEELVKTLSCMKPQDEIEGMLLTKMIALHRLSMRMLARIERAQTYESEAMYVKLSAQLTRLQNETIETFNRHRRRGEQRVIVQHVNIEDGGKAIVQSNVVGGDLGERRGCQPHE